MAESDRTREVLEAYLDLASTRSGRLMLDDLRKIPELTDPQTAEDVGEIPHPYRAYVLMGMSMLIKKIDGAIALAEHYRLHGYPADNDLEERDELDQVPES